ncbi:hypothetical protein B0H14DRAFT_2608262 [Mycena olivaceomarginata]|nr:hypothetical protein B0H14DRAFT_2608262 [Mycena olivaceomarginata]
MSWRLETSAATMLLVIESSINPKYYSHSVAATVGRAYIMRILGNKVSRKVFTPGGTLNPLELTSLGGTSGQREHRVQRRGAASWKRGKALRAHWQRKTRRGEVGGEPAPHAQMGGVGVKSMGPGRGGLTRVRRPARRCARRARIRSNRLEVRRAATREAGRRACVDGGRVRTLPASPETGRHRRGSQNLGPGRAKWQPGCRVEQHGDLWGRAPQASEGRGARTTYTSVDLAARVSHAGRPCEAKRPTLTAADVATSIHCVHQNEFPISRSDAVAQAMPPKIDQRQFGAAATQSRRLHALPHVVAPRSSLHTRRAELTPSLQHGGVGAVLMWLGSTARARAWARTRSKKGAAAASARGEPHGARWKARPPLLPWRQSAVARAWVHAEEAAECACAPNGGARGKIGREGTSGSRIGEVPGRRRGCRCSEDSEDGPYASPRVVEGAFAEGANPVRSPVAASRSSPHTGQPQRTACFHSGRSGRETSSALRAQARGCERKVRASPQRFLGGGMPSENAHGVAGRWRDEHSATGSAKHSPGATSRGRGRASRALDVEAPWTRRASEASGSWARRRWTHTTAQRPEWEARHGKDCVRKVHGPWRGASLGNAGHRVCAENGAPSQGGVVDGRASSIACKAISWPSETICVNGYAVDEKTRSAAEPTHSCSGRASCAARWARVAVTQGNEDGALRAAGVRAGGEARVRCGRREREHRASCSLSARPGSSEVRCSGPQGRGELARHRRDARTVPPNAKRRRRAG